MTGSRGFIYVQGRGPTSAIDPVVIEQGGLWTMFVAVPDRATAVKVALELVDSGVEHIELCGILGPIWAGEVIAAARQAMYR